MDQGLLFSILGAGVSLGGIFIAVGVIKGKVQQAAETNAVQAKQLESCVTRDELAGAIKRSDEMLEIMRKRADDDRIGSEGKYKDLYAILSAHSERITVLETNQHTIKQVLEDIRHDLNGGFNEIRTELREIWTQDK